MELFETVGVLLVGRMNAMDKGLPQQNCDPSKQRSSKLEKVYLTLLTLQSFEAPAPEDAQKESLSQALRQLSALLTDKGDADMRQLSTPVSTTNIGCRITRTGYFMSSDVSQWVTEPHRKTHVGQYQQNCLAIPHPVHLQKTSFD